MRTLTERKLAEEQKVTYETQKKAQETRQSLEKETAIAEIQKDIVKADQGVLIAQRIADASVKKAEGEASSVKIQASADAEKIKLLATAESQKVKALADADAERISLTGNAEAEKILAIGKSNAESYRLAIESMGGENFTQLKVMESIGKDKVKIIPDVLIAGNENGTNGPISGLLGLRLMEELSRKKNQG
jgi:uncharacterized membrane protein YqiK